MPLFGTACSLLSSRSWNVSQTANTSMTFMRQSIRWTGSWSNIWSDCFVEFLFGCVHGQMTQWNVSSSLGFTLLQSGVSPFRSISFGSNPLFNRHRPSKTFPYKTATCWWQDWSHPPACSQLPIREKGTHLILKKDGTEQRQHPWPQAVAQPMHGAWRSSPASGPPFLNLYSGKSPSSIAERLFSKTLTSSNKEKSTCRVWRPWCPKAAREPPGNLFLVGLGQFSFSVEPKWPLTKVHRVNITKHHELFSQWKIRGVSKNGPISLTTFCPVNHF